MERRQLYCSSIDGDIGVVIEWLGPTVDADQHRAAAATVPSQFNDAFVEGAPEGRRAAARCLVDAVEDLRTSPSGNPAAATAARSAFAELERTRSADCGPP